MCAPNKPTLIKAIGDLLATDFVSSGKKFSAHDVTKKLRELVLSRAKEINNTSGTVGDLMTTVINTPQIDTTETGTISIQGLQVPKIDHDDVKTTVHEIFNLGGMPGMGRIQHAAGYWEYDTQTNIDALAVAGTGTANGSSNASATGSVADPSGTTGSDYDGSSTL
jgi:hypothetical protein